MFDLSRCQGRPVRIIYNTLERGGVWNHLGVARREFSNVLVEGIDEGHARFTPVDRDSIDMVTRWDEETPRREKHPGSLVLDMQPDRAYIKIVGLDQGYPVVYEFYQWKLEPVT